ncbi:MAG: hypothetical protein IKD77_01515 [Bacilli bacterium]|nr:hypothetical protein [Bacilli bacterium]
MNVIDKEIICVDGKSYTVITQTKENGDIEGIYNILARYALEMISDRE